MLSTMEMLRMITISLACLVITASSDLTSGWSNLLSQNVTNGDSLLGSLKAPRYPKFLTNNPLPDGYPWGKRNVYNTDAYHHSPNTGVTRRYDWTISKGTLYPDGFKKDMLLVNNQFPGPVIEANWGDIVEVTVHNNITGEAPQQTAIHWHGVLQHGSIWYDGSPGLTQCPIAPGDSFTYRFKAELYGSAWWHAHLSAQWPNGLVGPMIIYGPWHVDYDIDLGPVMLSDWFHTSAEVIQKQLLDPVPSFVDASSDNNLINGKNPKQCLIGSLLGSDTCLPNAPYSQFRFTKGKKHRIRLINSGAQAVQKFSIDNHQMTVMANDYVPIKPYRATTITLGVGQRTDIIVHADQDDDRTYWMRSTATCAQTGGPDAKAVVTYGDDGSKYTPDFLSEVLSKLPNSISQLDLSSSENPPCGNDPLTKTEPTYKMALPKASHTEIFNIGFGRNSTGSWVWTLNGSSYLTDFDNPTLNLLYDHNTTYLESTEWRKPYFVPENATSYRSIIVNNSPSPHPMHMHGHNFYALYVSSNAWSDAEAAALETNIVRASNPQRRDVQQVPAGGYIVLQFDADNPGAWGFHCHMAFHIGAGFFMDVVEGKQKLLGASVPDEILRGCENWKAWNYRNLPLAKTYDSGQKRSSD